MSSGATALARVAATLLGATLIVLGMAWMTGR